MPRRLRRRRTRPARLPRAASAPPRSPSPSRPRGPHLGTCAMSSRSAAPALALLLLAGPAAAQTQTQTPYGAMVLSTYPNGVGRNPMGEPAGYMPSGVNAAGTAASSWVLASQATATTLSTATSSQVRGCTAARRPGRVRGGDAAARAARATVAQAARALWSARGSTAARPGRLALLRCRRGAGRHHAAARAARDSVARRGAAASAACVTTAAKRDGGCRTIRAADAPPSARADSPGRVQCMFIEGAFEDGFQVRALRCPGGATATPYGRQSRGGALRPACGRHLRAAQRECHA